MYVFISILIVIASLFLVFVVVIQNSKGGGLAAGFSSSNQVMGVRKTTDFLEKATWCLAGFVVVTCIFASIFIPHNQVSTESEIKDEILNTVPATDPNTVAPFSTPVPQDEVPVEE
ncbi:preprotein translocase subunit SecG [Bacteroidia bacterium]|nr:preprotein translocase subunit SecG [Bacteroidia bacterium]GHT26547.1 preprotein translocase subunit SecG [Bacteroidia bacterium]GHT87240.1 preprotein translocase subunit SecG [Bacteroidia bacterium]GHV71078.1 preprotein translocase subunit SecG [Bacteroidia bacterium]